MCQICVEISHLKHEIKPFVYLKGNRGLLFYYFEKISPYEYFLFKKDTTKELKPTKNIEKYNMKVIQL